MACAPLPLEKARPCFPPSSEARQASSAVRVGFPLREYSYPLCLPGSACTKVALLKMGVMIAPVEGSGDCPACTTRVASRSDALLKFEIRLLCFFASWCPGGED